RWNVSSAVAYACDSLLGVSFSFGDELSAHLAILNPTTHADRESDLRALQRFTKEVTPAVCNVYARSGLQARMGALERERIARDLHDGVVQSLTALALHLEDPKGEDRSGETAGANLIPLVRGEIQNIRSLIQELRASDLRPEELPSVFTEYCQK